MSDEEIRRRKTGDPEMDAIVVISQALTPLDSETCVRVLKWAEDRYVEQPKRDIKELAWVSVGEQVAAYKKYAADLGLDERELAHAIAHVRNAKGLAPIGDDPAAAATEGKAIAKVRNG